MAKLSALNGKAYISTDGGSNYTEIGNLTNVTIDSNTDMQDSSDNSDDSRSFLPGLDDWTATADAFFNESDAGQDAVRTALSGKTLVNFKFVPRVATGEVQWTGTGYFSGRSLNLVNLDGPVATNLTIRGSGVLTEGTQS